MDADISMQLRDRVSDAAASATPLAIVGGGSKTFLGRTTQAEPLAVGEHRGVIAYEPTELVVTARGGTALAALEAVLAEKDQMFAFEPPHFGATATLGGTIAAGLSGPRRPYAGAARDFVLGVKLLNGRAEILSFGGQVMKNVAGYDLSRLMSGAMGTLGVLLEISLKVLPRPARSCTLVFDLDPAPAVRRMNELAGEPLPISGAFHAARWLYLRLSGTPSGVDAAAQGLGGERIEGDATWSDLREHRLAFFDDPTPLWRISVPPATAPLALEGEALIDWGGALRWTKTGADGKTVRACVETAGGHATLFRNGDRTAEVYHPLSPALSRLHRRLKDAFDPKSILNRGRMYEDW